MEIVVRTGFEQDIKKLKKRRKDFSKLEYILEKLISEDALEETYKAHPLVGNWKPCWELHIEPDWLLVYYRNIESNQLILYRTGTHSDLF